MLEKVKYKDILQKPDYFKDHPSWDDLLLTKAQAWEHEQEVRIITKDPVWVHAGRYIPDEFKKEEVVDWKEIRHCLPLSRDCFESVYLGVNILPRNRAKIIDVAKKLNPNIEIYQMTLDPEAFRLKGEQVNI